MAIRTTPLAGPRRAPRPTFGAGAGSTGLAPAGSGEGTPTYVETARTQRLASLDFEESTSRRGGQSLEATQPGHRARRQRIRWFAYGILVGTVGSAMGGGGAEALLRAAREWSAGAVRTLDGRPVEAPPALPMGMAVTPGDIDAPAAVPTVRVDDLPPATREPGAASHGPTRVP